MTIHNPQAGATAKVDREVASAVLPKARTGRAGHQVVHVIQDGSKVQFEITGLDPTNYEAVVGPKKAEEYRAFVEARRNKVRPVASRRKGMLRTVLRMGRHT